MKFIEQVVSFGKDLGLFLIYSCGYCTSVFFDYTISWIPPIYGTLIRTITFFRTLLFAPIRIIIKVVLQLFLLPVNIPLRLFLGTSLKGILLFATSWTDGYVIFTILQYWLALTIFGVSIGAVCGTSLSILHSIWRIPDIYIEIPVKFWKHVPSLGAWVKNRLPFYRYGEAQLNGKGSEFKGAPPSPLLTPSSQSPRSPILADFTHSELPVTPKYRSYSKQSSRPPSISKESIMKVASKLPSDFFQQAQSGSKLDGERQPYMSPSQFSQDSTQNSSTELTNLWDKVEESPTTFKTEDGLATLSRRRTFLDSDKTGKPAAK
ncbi:hypothetical protein ZYGR_0AL01770 [Zygosaccharomyces rouxii]|uniref:Protein LDB16 n=1 Tax=Zygosaccharomyces rouxii TaxID=4956 RepID=A0A1Q3AFP1_ZYGRO|nr:hypothetical protein ZYGR_0AL01770 [Zygosaccharomyces rouxii]